MSTPLERLEEVHAAFAAALARRPGDLQAATTQAQVIAILANVSSLEASFLKAATAALAASGAQVEAAMSAAAAARQQIDTAYRDEKALGEKIRLVARGAKAVADLIKKAQA